jgi:hypothetical protein
VAVAAVLLSSDALPSFSLHPKTNQTGCLPGYAGNDNDYIVPGTTPARSLPEATLCIPCTDEDAQELTLRSEVLCSAEGAGARRRRRRT